MPGAAHRQPVDQLIGAERGMARQQRLQHGPAHGRRAARRVRRRAPRRARWHRWRSARDRGWAPGRPCPDWCFEPKAPPFVSPKCTPRPLASRANHSAVLYIALQQKWEQVPRPVPTPPFAALWAHRTRTNDVERQDRAGHRLHLRHRAGDCPRARQGRRQYDAQRLRRRRRDREDPRRHRKGLRGEGALLAGRHEPSRPRSPP